MASFESIEVKDGVDQETVDAVREVVLQSALGKFEQVLCRGILDVAATPTSVNFDLGTCKAHVTVNALVVVDVSDVLHGSPLRGKADDRELLPFLHSTCFLVEIPEHEIAGGFA